MLQSILSFPIVSLSISGILGVSSLILNNSDGLEAAKVIAAIGGTSYQTEANLKLKRNKLKQESEDSLDSFSLVEENQETD